MSILRFHGVVPFGEIDDGLMEYSVVAARHRGRWVCVRLKGRRDWCFPGGRREDGETLEENARRELYEETGAMRYHLYPLGLYGVDHRHIAPGGQEERERLSWGGLYGAEIDEFDGIPAEYEIAERRLFEAFPLDAARFPHIMPGMMEWLHENMVLERGAL